jgi:hypothetical protein
VSRKAVRIVWFALSLPCRSADVGGVSDVRQVSR